MLTEDPSKPLHDVCQRSTVHLVAKLVAAQQGVEVKRNSLLRPRSSSHLQRVLCGQWHGNLLFFVLHRWEVASVVPVANFFRRPGYHHLPLTSKPLVERKKQSRRRASPRPAVERKPPRTTDPRHKANLSSPWFTTAAPAFMTSMKACLLLSVWFCWTLAAPLHPDLNVYVAKMVT